MKYTVETVADALGKSKQTVRCLLQEGKLSEIGMAYKVNGSSQWSYVFYPAKCKEYLGQ